MRDHELKLSHDRIQPDDNTPAEIAAATKVILRESDADTLLAMLGLDGAA